MDFGQVLHTAKKNEKLNQNGVRYYSTKFEPPKKEKKSSQLSENIKKFLAKKEAEEKRKAEEEKKRKEELLALRSQDKKATRRVNVMLKRTKSANQSVIDDAVDNDNTAVTLAGPLQPDEDDYGYVSQEASAFYNKMMEKYSKMPDEPKFNMEKKRVSINLGSTKDRVKAALEREKEEAMMPRKRKRKHKERNMEDDEDGVSYAAPDRDVERENETEMPPPKPKPKPKPAPPPMNFAELLRIAEQKQHEPIIIEKKEKEEEKPLTKKQKKEAERQRDYIRRKEERLKEGEQCPPPRPDGSAPPNKIPKLSDKISSDSKNSLLPSKLGKQNPIDRIPKVDSVKSSYSSNKISKNPDVPRHAQDHYEKSNKITSKQPSKSQATSSLSNREHHKTSSGVTRDPKCGPNSIDNNNSLASKDLNMKKTWQESKLKKHLEQPLSKPSDRIPSHITNRSSTDDRPRKYLPGDLRAKNQQPEDFKSKQLPPADLKTKKNSFTSNSTESQIKQLPLSSAKPKTYPPIDKPKQYPPAAGKPKQYAETDGRPKQLPPADGRPKQFPPADVKPKQFPPSDVRPKQFPPKDLKPKQFPPPDMQRRGPPMVKKKVAPPSKRRVIDDDSEYDSEMDDFIDDDEPEEDYSKYIKDIFGYDKSRYRGVDDDIDNMESTFAQQMREEVISTKIGIMEDLEDIKKEEEEKRRKALIKKKKL